MVEPYILSAWSRARVFSVGTVLQYVWRACTNLSQWQVRWGTRRSTVDHDLSVDDLDYDLSVRGVNPLDLVVA